MRSGGWMAACSAVAASVLVIGPQRATLALGAVLALLLLLRFSQARLGWFIGGALLVFQASSSVGASKLAYLAGLGLVTAVSAFRVARSDAAWLEPFRVLLPATAAVLAVISASAIVATAYSPMVLWVRDASPYLMVAAAPVIALDAAHDVRESRLHGMIAALGVVTAIGVATDWLDRRGASSLPVGRIIFATGSIAVLAMCLGLAKIAARQHSIRWAAITVTIPCILLTTGTRSIATYTVMLLGVIGRRRHNRMSAARVAFLGAGVVLLIVVLAPILAGIAGNEAFFEQRVQLAFAAWENRGAGDQSFQERTEQYALSWHVWNEHRWWGIGPGVLGPLDTPVITLAKFGLVGTAVFLAFLMVMVRAATRAGRTFGWAPAHTAIRCFVLVTLVSVPFGSRLEDKGFSLAISLAVCLVAVAARDAGEPSGHPEAGHVEERVGAHAAGVQCTAGGLVGE